MQNYSVEDARKTTARIEGWLTDSEGRFLYNTAKMVKKGGGVIVEIGSWKGKSAVWLGSGSKAGSRAKVYAIDPHKTQFQTNRFSGSSGDFYAVHGQHSENTKFGAVSMSLYEFKKNIKAAGVADIIITIAKTSEEASKTWKKGGGKIAFLWIDGAHNYESVEKDFLLWSPRLIDGGTIAFHDTLTEGPRRVVEKYVFNSNQFKNAGFVDSLVFATKVKRNSFSDRLRNNCVLYIKTFYGLLAGLSLPAWLRSFGKKIFRTLQR